MSPRLAVIAHEEKLRPKDAGELRSCLARQGFRKIAWLSIPKGRAATKATRKAVEGGADRVLVAGGDGTVRAAVQTLAGTDVPLAVYPAGTANLFAGALDLPSGPEAVAAAVWHGATRRIDTAVCNDLAFAVMAGTGLDAMMIDDADAEKDRLGTLAYVKAGIGAARAREPFPVEVTIDGSPFFDGRATCVLFGNVGRLPAGLRAFPDARPDDGVLDVAVVTASSVREWGSVMWSAVRRRQHDSGHALLGQGARFAVHLDGRHRIELDGGSKGAASTLDVRIRPASLAVCVMPPDMGTSPASPGMSHP